MFTIDFSKYLYYNKGMVMCYNDK